AVCVVAIGALAVACGGEVSPFGLPNRRGVDTLSSSVALSVQAEQGTALCGRGAWKPIDSLRLLGLEPALKATKSDGVCPNVPFGDSAYVGVVAADSLILTGDARITLSLSATTSGALANWVLPDINAYLVQVAEPSGKMLGATLVNYVTFARTIEPPPEVAVSASGPFSLHLVLIEKVRSPCPSAKGSISTLEFSRIELTTLSAPSPTIPMVRVQAACK